MRLLPARSPLRGDDSRELAGRWPGRFALPLAVAALAVSGLALAGCGVVNVTTEVAPTAHAAVKASAGGVKSATASGSVSTIASSTTSLGANVTVPTDQLFTSAWFAPDSPWNTMIVTEPTDVSSATLIHRGLESVEVIDQPGSQPPTLERVYSNPGLFVNTTSWTDPVVQGGVETPLHCRQVDCGPGNAITQLPVPQGVSPNPLYDGWFTIISPNGKEAYDLWRARRLSNGTISYQYMRAWSLDGSGYGSPGQGSARGSGLPLFAGLIRPAELQAGQIDHALAISIPAPAADYYVPPASSTDGNGATDSLPEGARLRLKPNVMLPSGLNLTPQQLRYASALLWTLRNYGAIVVGRASVPTLYAQGGVTSSLLTGAELQWLHLTDFQVVQLPQEYQYPSPFQPQSASGGSESAVEGN